MSKCERCSGSMLPGDDGLRCIMCGHDNQPPVLLSELRERDRRTLAHHYGGHADVTVETPDRHRPSIDLDGTYQRCVDALKKHSAPFLASELAEEIGTSSGQAGACLRRARRRGLVQDIGMVRLANPDRLNHGLVAQWQVIP